MVSGSWDARELPLLSPGVRSRTGGEIGSAESELRGVCRTFLRDFSGGPLSVWLGGLCCCLLAVSRHGSCEFCGICQRRAETKVQGLLE